MKEKEFIEKIEKQNGWINSIDAFQLVHLYTMKYGIEYTKLNLENELIYMWQKLKQDLK